MQEKLPSSPVTHAAPFAKQIIGTAGDRVVVGEDRRVTIWRTDGHIIEAGLAKTHDSKGRAMHIAAPGVIPAGKYFVVAPSRTSFDSRYAAIGLVHQAQIEAKLFPLPDIMWLGLRGPEINGGRP